MPSLPRIVRVVVYLFVLGLFFQFTLPGPGSNATVFAQPGQPDGFQPPVPVTPSETPPRMNFQPPGNANKLVDFVPPNAKVTQLDTGPGKRAIAAIHSSGDHVFSSKNDTVAVVIEQETFPNQARIQFTEIDQPESRNLATAPNLIDQPLSNEFLARFDIDIMDSNNDLISSFDKPVRLVIDLRNLINNLNMTTPDFFLAYWDEEIEAWRSVPTTIHQQNGLISAEVTHFSSWAAGVRPDRWVPVWTPPAVSAFSGAATYSYPFNIPPGRNGLQPNLTLSYSSRVMDGRIHSIEKGASANGWALNEISIVRVGVKIRTNFSLMETYHPNEFRLVLNGNGHRLIPTSLAATSGDEPVDYFVEQQPGMRVTRYYDPNLNNQEGIYWIVKTPEGTQYRLGYTPDAEVWQSVPSHYHITIDGHLGKPNDTSALAWHVDTVTDVYGNQMQYSYYTKPIIELIKGSGDRDDFYLTTQKNRIAQIYYNYSKRYTGTLPIPSTVPQPNSISGNTAGSRIEFLPDNDPAVNGRYRTDPVTQINVYHSGSSTPITQYQLDIEYRVKPSDGDPDGNGEGGDAVSGSCRDEVTHNSKATATWVLTGITELSGGYSLPTTKFEYAAKPHFHKNNYGCFYFSYLTDVWNGYGGHTQFTYTSDNRKNENWTFDYVGGNNEYKYPPIGYNYFVTAVTHNDGRNPNTTTEYVYERPCYGQWGNDVGTYNNPIKCHTPGVEEVGNVVGFFQTTIINKGYANEILNVQKSEFAQVDNLTNQGQVSHIGRPLQEEVYGNDGTTLLQRTTTSYLSTAPYFTYANQVITTQYNSGLGSPAISSKVKYEYNPALQGNQQYGNVTRIYEYDSADPNAAPYRITQRRYYPNTTNWIVNKLSTEKTLDGNENLLRGSWTYYDNGTRPSDQPTKGAVTRVDQFIPVSCAGLSSCDKAYDSIVTKMGYDEFGNQINITTYSDYGFRAYDVNNNWIDDFVPSSNPQTTSTAYETVYHLYPIAVTNAAGHVTTFEIYGFNGVPLEGFQKQPGLLKKVTDPNGVTTIYEYDPFGRLFGVYDNPSQQGDLNDHFDGTPVKRILYWDNSWNHGMIRLPSNGTGPFMITTEDRPNTNEIVSVITHYDGFGRTIQERKMYAEVDGSSGVRDIIVSTEYNAQGQAYCVTTPFDLPTIVWPDSGFVTTGCENRPHTTTTYDALGRPTVVTAPDGAQTNLSYKVKNNIIINGDSHFNWVQTKNANNHVINRFYDGQGKLVQVREYTGTGTTQDPYQDYAFTTYSYDLMGNLETVTDATGDNMTTMNYDALGRKTSMDDPDMGAWEYEYDATGNLVRQEDANDKAICFYYDNLNRLARKVSLDNQLNPCPADVNQAQGSGPNHLASYVYDRLQVQEEFDGTALPVGWTKSGTVSVSGGQVHMTGNGSDWGTNVVKSDALQDGEGMRISFKLTGSSPAATVYLDSGAWAQSNYRRWGFLIQSSNIYWATYEGTASQTGQLMSLKTGVWYEAQLIVDGTTNGFHAVIWERDNPSVSNSHTQSPSTSWAGLNWKFVSQVKAGTSDIESYTEFLPSENGRLASVNWGPDPSQNFDTFSYDNLGRMNKQVRTLDNLPYTMETLTYDSLNRPLTVKYPNNEVITMSYDHEGENTLQAGSDLLVDNVTYNTRGQMARLERPNGLDTVFNYYGETGTAGTGNGNFRLETIQHGTTSDSLSDFNYEYDKVGNITSISDGQGDLQNFDYDHLNRLTSFDVSSLYGIGYQYDKLGNITNRSVGGGVNSTNYSYSYPSVGGQVHAVSTITSTEFPSGTTANFSFEYDNNGNMTSRTDTTGTYTQVFDVENRLTGVTKTGIGTTTFAYDANGQRVMTVKPNGSIIYSPFPNYEEEIRPLPPTPTPTNTPVPTNTPPPTATNTPLPTATSTLPPTATPVPPTATFTPTATLVPPTATFTPTVTTAPPTATPSAIHINFQLGTAPIPANYLMDDGSVYGDRGNGYSYGWSDDITTTGRDRDNPDSQDQRYDTLLHLQKPEAPNASWEIAVPNGNYEVHLVTGDADWYDSVYKLEVEGILVVDGVPDATTFWLEGTSIVTVSDGRLTITSASGADNNKINFIDITATTATPAPPTATSAPPTATSMPPTATPVTPTATAVFTTTPTATPSNGRVTDGLQTLYTFEEGSGSVVNDVSGVGTPLTLTISDTNAVTWLAGGGLSIDAETIISSAGAATKVINAAQASNELTIEAWVEPANITQGGPARIATLSLDTGLRNFTLGQSTDFYQARLRTTSATNNGLPVLDAPTGVASTALTHVVFTRQADGTRRIYVNNAEVVNDSVTGDFSNWNTAYRLALANELTEDRPWLGTLHLVAVYDRALTAAEIEQNFSSGVNESPLPPTPTSTPPPSAGGDVIFVSSSTSGTVGGVTYTDWDILAYDTNTETWPFHFDGSDTDLSGQTTRDVHAVHPMADDSILHSMAGETTIPDTGSITSTPDGFTRPLKKATTTHMAKPVTVQPTSHTTAETTNSVTAQTSGEIVIQRVTYSLAGQAIAVRVTGDPDPTNNGLFYLHNDHLGSTSVMSYGFDPDGSGPLTTGDMVPNSTARYTPFGDWRTEPGTNPEITDRGYTGHAHNNSGANDLGLIYMNARYYVSGIGRFASADTIVPDPANPQSWNRYSYTYNNPLNLIDPSGHRPSDGCNDEGCLTDPDSWGDGFIDYLTENTDFSDPNDNPAGQIIVRTFDFILPLGMEDGASINEIVAEAINGSVSFINHGMSGFYPVANTAELLTVSGAFIYALESDLGEKAEGIGNGGEYLLSSPSTHKHHIFPQQFGEDFEALGIDIDQHTVVLSQGEHLSGVHGRGGFVGSGNVTYPGKWNQRWGDFFANNPNPTSKEVYQYAGSLMDEFGLSNMPIVPYR